MAWQSSGKSNSQLINNLFKNGLIKHERVKNAMLAVDRANYCPSSPYEDSPQAIGYAATISAPHMHVHACELLLPYLNPDSRVLDIGSGSGYLTHVLTNLVTDDASTSSKGSVIGIDHIKGLVDMCNTNMAKSESGRRLLESGKARFVLGDGRLGYPEGGPYDAIHVGAAAETMHAALIDQLRAPGRMFIPVESGGENGVRSFGLGGGTQHVWVVDKKEDGSVVKEKIFGVSYVPLTDAPKERV
ncbi:protein-L-isoaspartate O-methyltransferase [[Emmonsia] crescens]|uniref:Protein-L-isoaspartate O-methyltransferase n=1 Tax=[Emmonsia] crescens TaxID=73230 RepID=A0A0G2I349_9EURO|nr:protein-L-isoaspartate O-methyltransferase [Emmonsia crescens UAMH 3008]